MIANNWCLNSFLFYNIFKLKILRQDGERKLSSISNCSYKFENASRSTQSNILVKLLIVLLEHSHFGLDLFIFWKYSLMQFQFGFVYTLKIFICAIYGTIATCHIHLMSNIFLVLPCHGVTEDEASTDYYISINN